MASSSKDKNSFITYEEAEELRARIYEATGGVNPMSDEIIDLLVELEMEQAPNSPRLTDPKEARSRLDDIFKEIDTSPDPDSDISSQDLNLVKREDTLEHGEIEPANTNQDPHHMTEAKNNLRLIYKKRKSADPTIYDVQKSLFIGLCSSLIEKNLVKSVFKETEEWLQLLYIPEETEEDQGSQTEGE